MLSKVGDCEAFIDEVIEQATQFVATCYGNKVNSRSEVSCELE